MASRFQQVPGVQRRRFGDIVVTALNDGFIELPFEAVVGISAAESDALFRAAGRRPPYRTAINAYLVETDGRRVLVDAGCGRFMGPHLGKFATNLGTAGVTADEIELIVITHMHPDHIGGLLTDSDEARYPRAKIMVSTKELAYWSDDVNRAASPESTRDSFDITRLVRKAYDGRIETFEGATPIIPGIRAVPLNGHTPGHTGYEIGMASPELVIWGDVTHAPELQFARPELTVIFDVDQDRARQSRRMIIERAVNEELMIAGMHIPFPGFIRIARKGDAYASFAQVWQYDLLD